MLKEFARKLAVAFLAIAIVGMVGVVWLLASQAVEKSYEEIHDWWLRENRAPSSAVFKNWGLTNNQAKSHIDAPCAWEAFRPKADVIVAVIDTGVDPNHPNLGAAKWCDPDEKDECWYGWDFQTGRVNPIDEHGHGTHIAGIISASRDENAGVAGVSPRVRIMSIKYYSKYNSGSINLRHTVQAFNYAIEHGAQIINYSGGGPEFSEDEYLALKKAEEKGILVVTAAGNEHQNADVNENYYYPASYRLSNIITVAASDIRNNLLATSNWGKKRVDLAAPGENIYSTLPKGRFGYMSGTSQATAFVTGVAAMILSEDPSLKPAEVKKIIVSTVDRFPQLENKVASGGRLNACAAVKSVR